MRAKVASKSIDSPVGLVRWICPPGAFSVGALTCEARMGGRFVPPAQG